MKKIYRFCILLLLVLFIGRVDAQTITPVPYYSMLNWDTSPYKSYRYTRPNASWEWINFRMLFPNGYDSTAMDGKEYPLIIMLHGAGESARMKWDNSTKTNTPYPDGDPRIDNNDHQLLFGGKEHLNAVKNGRFPGFVVFPQNFYGTWVNGRGDANSGLHRDLQKAMELAEVLVQKLKVDPSRIYIHGLSNGGAGTWYAAYSRPDLFAAALPMSAPGDPAMANQLAAVPLWVFQGELDTNPRPATTQQTVNAVLNAGGEVRYTEYANTTHNTWNRAYGESDFFEWMLAHSKKNTDEPNQAPTVNAGIDKTVTLPTNSTSFKATAADPDGAIASYLWEKVSGPAITMAGTTSATLSLSNLVAGIYTFKVTVKDDKGAIAADEVELIVNPAANQAPTVNAGADKAITLPTNTSSFTATASDPDGTISTYVWEKVSGPAAGTMAGQTTSTLSLSDLDVGIYVFRITVTDNSGAKAFDEVKLTVSSANNQLPTVNAGADKSITLPTNTSSFTASASDPDGTIASYLWEKVSGPAATLSGANTATLSVSNLVEGNYAFKVTVKDDKGATASDQVNLVVKSSDVNQGNQVPVAYAGSDKSITLPENSKTLFGSAKDSDGRLVAYRWEKVSGPAVTTTNSNTANVNLTNLVEGEYVFRFSATDNGGATGSDEMTLTVIGNNTPTNQSPSVNAGADKSITLPTNTSSFTASASDPDGTIASYLWEKVSGPAATLSGANTATLSVSNLVEGTYAFKVTVKDDKGATASDQVNLVVKSSDVNQGNQVPVAYAGSDKSITLPENSKTLFGSAKDSDGRLVAYRWEKVSGPAVTMTNSNTANVNLANLVEGVYVYRFSATDNGGATGSDEMTLTVIGNNTPNNQSPTVNAGADKSITLPTNTSSFTASASDPDGTIASYLWEKVSGPAATMSGTTTSKLSVSNLVEGTYAFKVTVKDDKGATASDQVNLVVNGGSTGNQVPVAYAGSDKSITLPENSKTLYGRATDSDGRLIAYRWEKVSGPAVTMTNSNTANVNLTNLVEGEYVFRFSATDNGGATGSDEMTLTVLKGASGALMAQASPPVNKVLAFPNTFEKEVTLRVESEEKDEAFLVTVFDFQGRSMHKQQFQVQAGSPMEISLDLSGLTIPAGTYLIQVKGKNTPFLEIVRVVKR